MHQNLLLHRQTFVMPGEHGLGSVPSTQSMHSTQVGSFLSFFGDQGPCSYPIITLCGCPPPPHPVTPAKLVSIQCILAFGGELSSRETVLGLWVFLPSATHWNLRSNSMCLHRKK